MTKKKQQDKNKYVILDNATKIRAAYQSGKKLVELNGRVFRMERLDHHIVMHNKNGERKEYDESWIKVSPADGSLTPCGQIERAGFNSRTH
jgi:carbonic anhydrase